MKGDCIMDNRSRPKVLKGYRRDKGNMKDKNFLRLAKCLVAAKDELNINLFWDDREERFIRRYIDFVDDTSGNEEACLH